jgi:deoxyribodipyrimidine photo-lyase
MNTDLTFIYDKIEAIEPVSYAKNRNYIDGAVSKLSPYISRGVISTKEILNSLLERGFNPNKIEKFIQELAWRDYWQQIWIEKQDLINSDLKNNQLNVDNHQIPKAIVEGNCSIEAIDNAIKEFYNTGYIHNHVRMYIAAISCNNAKSHWKAPAQWMYYHLLDGDWASNALSWQWVCGANSNKLYFANQDNINKYCYTQQKNTFLDVDYSEFYSMDIPSKLKETVDLKLATPLPKNDNSLQIDTELPSLIYNYYNLDPKWRSEQKANRILLIEPSVFENYPISKKSMDFMLNLSKNIDNIQLFVGSFEELKELTKASQVYFKEHPLNTHYKGIEDQRDWMFTVKGYYSSFFKFWNKCKKELKTT